MLTVRFFASLREIVGASELQVQSEKGAKVEEIYGRLAKDHPRLTGYRASLLVAVNGEYSAWDRVVSDGDEVAFFPPVSGG